MSSEEMMPQQPLTFNGGDIPAYGITDDIPFGDEAGGAMLSFEEMFDDTNMFDWVRDFFLSSSLSFILPFLYFKRGSNA